MRPLSRAGPTDAESITIAIRIFTAYVQVQALAMKILLSWPSQVSEPIEVQHTPGLRIPGFRLPPRASRAPLPRPFFHPPVIGAWTDS